jgi:hypothetical protein
MLFRNMKRMVSDEEALGTILGTLLGMEGWTLGWCIGPFNVFGWLSWMCTVFCGTIGFSGGIILDALVPVMAVIIASLEATCCAASSCFGCIGSPFFGTTFGSVASMLGK